MDNDEAVEKFEESFVSSRIEGLEDVFRERGVAVALNANPTLDECETLAANDDPLVRDWALCQTARLAKTQRLAISACVNMLYRLPNNTFKLMLANLLDRYDSTKEVAGIVPLFASIAIDETLNAVVRSSAYFVLTLRGRLINTIPYEYYLPPAEARVSFMNSNAARRPNRAGLEHVNWDAIERHAEERLSFVNWDAVRRLAQADDGAGP